MSPRSGRQKKHVPPSQRWYYDACTLDENLNTYAEILNTRKRPIKFVVSHLAIGEAYGNILRKEGLEAAQTFLELVLKFSEYIEIVNNNGIGGPLEKITADFRMESSDAIHLATAINNRCNLFKTIDTDFLNQDPKKIKELAKEFGMNSFKIVPVDNKK